MGCSVSLYLYGHTGKLYFEDLKAVQKGFPLERQAI